MPGKKMNNTKNYDAHVAFKKHQKANRPKQIALAVYGDDYEDVAAIPVTHEWVHIGADLEQTNS